MRTLSLLATAATAALALAGHAGAGVVPPPVPSAVAAVPGPDVATLLAAARGAPPVLCALAANALGNLGNSGWAADAPAPPLGRALGDDDERGAGLARLGATEVEPLLGALATDDACVRELAVRVLGRQREPATVAAVASGLAARLAAPSPAVRAAAAFGLGLAASGRDGTAATATAVVPLTRTLGDAASDVRANAAWALGRIEDGRALAPLVARVGDPDARVREAVVGAVGRFESTSTAGLLARVLRQDAAPGVRRVAAWALGNLDARDGAGEPSQALAAALARDADPRVREMAAWALAERETTSAAPALAAALRGDASDAVRETAAWALAELDDEGRTPGATDALSAAAGADPSARVRGTAAWALGQTERQAAPAGLLRAVRDADAGVRLKAAWALGQVRDAGALPALRDALGRETDPRTRGALVRALVHAGGRSEPALAGLLQSGDARVREAAVRGLVGREAFSPWPWPQPRPRPFP